MVSSMTDDFQSELWRMHMGRDIKGLVQMLRHQNPVARRRAAAALRTLNATEAVASLTEALEKEPIPETRASIVAAIDALQEINVENTDDSNNAEGDDQQPEAPSPQSDLVRLVQLLKNADPEVAVAAARELGELNDKLAVEPLIFLFNAPDTPINVRLAVAEALLELNSAPVEVTLLAALRSPEWRTRRNGAAILGKLKAAWAVEPLTEALTDTNGAVRLTAHAALRHIGTQESMQALAAASDKNDEQDGKNALPPNKDPMPRSSTAELRRIREETKPKRPTNPDGTPVKFKTDETHKIAWPRRTRRKEREASPHIAPTKPLNPETLEEAQARLRAIQARRGKNSDQ